jgi:hypothetical protein
MSLIYSNEDNDNNSRDKTTTSRARYSRKDSSDDNNNHTDHYKQGKQQPDVAPRGDERQEQMHAEKRVRDLEDDVKELEAVNKRLKKELKNSKKRVSRSSKGDIRNSNGWMGDKAILANKVTKFSRDYMFPRYKFLKEGWQDYNPTNKKSTSNFVGRKMADTYRSMRIPTIGMEFEDQWERVYVPVIGLKYQNMIATWGMTYVHSILVSYTRNCDELPESSQRAPRELPESSQRAPRELPESSQRACKELPELLQ